MELVSELVHMNEERTISPETCDSGPISSRFSATRPLFVCALSPEIHLPHCSIIPIGSLLA